LQKQNTVLNFGTITNSNPEILIDSTQKFQVMDGFGYTLTGGSVQVINQLNPVAKAELLEELFGEKANAIGVSYLRLSVGASDLNESVFSYNDLPAGQTDVNLKSFSLSQDETTLIPLLKEILKINPKIKLMASPWSPPTWMKNNGSAKGGSLLPEYHETYANYLVKYIKTMKMNGIDIDALTVQNEPLNASNNPSMLMTSAQQNVFIKTFLGPIFRSNAISTKIILFDHNCDTSDYPISILNDEQTKVFVDGSAFHLYAGDISAMSTVKNAHQDKNIYFTEQWTSSTGDFGGDFMWHIKNVIIGAIRNWLRLRF
jgi:glucosylceramidase